MCTQPPKDYFRHKYYEAVDVVIAELERRFDRSSSTHHFKLSWWKSSSFCSTQQRVKKYRWNTDVCQKLIQNWLIDMPRLHAQGMLRDVVRPYEWVNCVQTSDRTITISSIINRPIMSHAGMQVINTGYHSNCWTAERTSSMCCVIL